MGSFSFLEILFLDELIL